MKRSRFACLLLVAGLALASLVIVASNPAAPADPQKDWKEVIGWQKTLADEAATRKRICELAANLLGTDYTTVQAGRPFHYNCIKALALMQALPALAEQARVNNKPFVEKKTVAALVSEVLNRALPEFAEAAGVAGPAKPLTAKLTVKQLRAQLGDPITSDEKKRTYYLNYVIPMILLVAEFYFAGGLEVEASGTSPFASDRDAQTTVRLPPAAQLGVARLVALMLSNDQGAVRYPTDEPRPLVGSLWEYNTFGQGPICFSKSGTVAMGLRAAVNMGLLDFKPEAFRFAYTNENKTDLQRREDFFRRLADVAFHAVRTVVEQSPPEGKDVKTYGVEGEAAFDAQDHGPKALSGHNVLDISEYRVVYGSNPTGELLSRVERLEGSGLSSRGVPRPVGYRYLDKQFRAYHTASAGYVLLTCSNVLVSLLEKRASAAAGGTLGHHFHWGPAEEKGSWKVTSEDPTKAIYQMKADAAGPYTRLSLKRDGVELRSINDRIIQSLNLCVTLLTADGNGERKMDETTQTPWKKTITFVDEPSLPFCLFGVMKTCLSCGHPDYLGPFPWYREFARVLIAAPLPAAANGSGAAEFSILVLSRSYRPVFIRSQIQGK